MAKVLFIGLQKGGPGKTTLTRNLGYALAQKGQRVLTIDFDGQANLTMSCGIDHPETLEQTIANLMELELDCQDLPAPETYICSVDGVDLIPSNKYLTVVETKMRMEVGCDQILSNIVAPLRKNYDYILIDTGPAEGILMVNALCAADAVLIPMDLQLFSMAGVQEILKATLKLRRRVKPDLQIAGIVFNRYDVRTNLSKQIIEDTKAAYESQIHLFSSTIPQTVRIGEAHYFAKAVGAHAPFCSASKAFDHLAEEILQQSHEHK